MCFSSSDLIMVATMSERKFPTRDFFFLFWGTRFLGSAAAAAGAAAAAAAGAAVGISLSNAEKVLWLVWVVVGWDDDDDDGLLLWAGGGGDSSRLDAVERFLFFAFVLLVRLFFWERVAADAVLVDLRFLEVVVVVVVVLLGWRPFSEKQHWTVRTP